MKERANAARHGYGLRAEGDDSKSWAYRLVREQRHHGLYGGEKGKAWLGCKGTIRTSEDCRLHKGKKDEESAFAKIEPVAAVQSCYKRPTTQYHQSSSSISHSQLSLAALTISRNYYPILNPTVTTSALAVCLPPISVCLSCHRNTAACHR